MRKQTRLTSLCMAGIFCCSIWLSPAAKAGLFEEAVSGKSEQIDMDQSPTANSQVELNGHMRADYFVGKGLNSDQLQSKQAYGEAKLKLRVRKGSWGDGFADIRFLGSMGPNGGSTAFKLRETYVNTYLGPFDIRLGKQIIVWGKADGFNPTNNITPMDMGVRSPNEDDRRLGNWGVRAYYNALPFRLEAVWMPIYRASQLPKFKLPGPITLMQNPQIEPALTKSLGAIRAHLQTAAIEMSASYTYGLAPLGGLQFRGIQQDAEYSLIQLSLTPYEQYVIGYDFSTTIANLFGVRGETAFRRPVAYELHAHRPNPDLQYVLGIDKELFSKLHIIAQYIGRYVLDFPQTDEIELPIDLEQQSLPAPLPPFLASAIEQNIQTQIAKRTRMIVGQTHKLQHSISLRIAYAALYETLNLELAGVYNLTSLEWMLRPKISYEISDALACTIGGEFYHGPEDTLYNLISDIQSAAFVELKANF